jgi:hypothetical protein
MEAHATLSFSITGKSMVREIDSCLKDGPGRAKDNPSFLASPLFRNKYAMWFYPKRSPRQMLEVSKNVCLFLRAFWEVIFSLY